jgi:hypothetical protein
MMRNLIRARRTPAVAQAGRGRGQRFASTRPPRWARLTTFNAVDFDDLIRLPYRS